MSTDRPLHPYFRRYESIFTDVDTANKVIREVLLANQTTIEAWLRDAHNVGPKVFDSKSRAHYILGQRHMPVFLELKQEFVGTSFVGTRIAIYPT